MSLWSLEYQVPLPGITINERSFSLFEKRNLLPNERNNLEPKLCCVQCTLSCLVLFSVLEFLLLRSTIYATEGHFRRIVKSGWDGNNSNTSGNATGLIQINSDNTDTNLNLGGFVMYPSSCCAPEFHQYIHGSFHPQLSYAGQIPFSRLWSCSEWYWKHRPIWELWPSSSKDNFWRFPCLQKMIFDFLHTTI